MKKYSTLSLNPVVLDAERLASFEANDPHMFYCQRLRLQVTNDQFCLIRDNETVLPLKTDDVIFFAPTILSVKIDDLNDRVSLSTSTGLKDDEVFEQTKKMSNQDTPSFNFDHDGDLEYDRGFLESEKLMNSVETIVLSPWREDGRQTVEECFVNINTNPTGMVPVPSSYLMNELKPIKHSSMLKTVLKKIIAFFWC
jgi:hypothetical protein